MGVILRKYNTATAAGTHIRIPVIKASSNDFATSSDWTPVAGDVKVSKDGGAEANIATLPTYSNGAWEFQLSAAELSAKSVTIKVVDSATKAVEDQYVIIETYGHASAMYVQDLAASTYNANVTTIAANAITASALAADAAGEIADAVLDEPLSAHTSVGTLGQALQSIRSGTAQSGTATSITLDSGASAVNSFYNRALLVITGGTGIGQARFITDYSGSSKIASVDNWATNPDSTSQFVILPFAAIPGATAPTATDNAAAVWNALRASYAAAGTFGEYVLADAVRISGNTDAADNAQLMFDGTGYAGGTIKLDVNVEQWNATSVPAEHTAGYPIVTIKDGTGTGEIDTNAGKVSIATGGITSSSLATSAIDVIVDGVWDEDIVAAHGSADTAGRCIRTLDAISDRSNNANLNALLGVTDTAGRDLSAEMWLETSRTLSAATNITSTGSAITLHSDAKVIIAGTTHTSAVVPTVTSVTNRVTANTDQIEGLDATDQLDSRINARIVAYGLDHLVSAAAIGTDITDNSIVAKLVSKSSPNADWDSYDPATDSLEALRDRGDAAWGASGAPTVAQIVDGVWDEPRADHVTGGTFGQGIASVQGNVTGSVASVTGNVAGFVGSVAGNVAGNVTGTIGGFTTAAKAEINTEADAAIADYGPLKPTITGRTLDVSATGEAGIDWANVGTPGATVNLAATTILTATNVEADTSDIQSRLPAALVGGRMDSSVGAYASGLAPLQPTVAGRTLDVSATGEAGLDFNNIGQASGATTLTNITIPTVTAVTNIVTANATQIEGLDATDQLATAINARIVAYGLDHLVSLDTASSDVANGSIVARLVSASATPTWSSFDNTTDSLQAIRDRGDAAWGGSASLTAADVWAHATRTLTSGANIVLTKGTGLVGLNDLSAAQVNGEVDTALADISLDHLFAAAVGGSDVINDSFAAKLVSKAATADFDTYVHTTDSMEAIRDRGDIAWTGTPSAADIRSAIGLASANLDTQLAAIDDYIDTEVAAIKAKTDSLTFTGTDLRVTLDGETVALSATGLDAVTASTPASGDPTTWSFPQWVLMLMRRFFYKATLSASDLRTYDADGTTIRTTQSVSSVGGTESQGKAS
jgi:hypothetical protein